MDDGRMDRPRRFKHIFLDAEGTLYVPRAGKSRWRFWDNPSPEDAVDFFELDKGVLEAVKAIRSRAETLCLVSRNTAPILAAMLHKYGLERTFDCIMLNGDKGKNIEKYLRAHGYRKEDAVMVGDMPTLDLFPVRRAGIEAILVDRPYNRWVKGVERIKGLNDFPGWLRIADIAETIERDRVRNATLDEFMGQTSSGPPTQSLIATPGA